MNLHWIGAALIIVGCGGVGFGMALNYKREEAALNHLIKALEYMRCELEYRITPLPELCQKVAAFTSGSIRLLFRNLMQELNAQISPDTLCCMKAALKKTPEMPKKTAAALLELGRSLGQFDLDGQVSEISAVILSCKKELQDMQAERSQRLRSYQTLGLCAGAALAILFI